MTRKDFLLNSIGIASLALIPKWALSKEKEHGPIAFFSSACVESSTGEQPPMPKSTNVKKVVPYRGGQYFVTVDSASGVRNGMLCLNNTQSVFIVLSVNKNNLLLCAVNQSSHW